MTRREHDKRTGLGRWLKKRGVGRFINQGFLLVVAFSVFSLLILVMGDKMPESYKLYAVVASALITVALGASIGDWWTKSGEDNDRRVEAKRIDDRIEDEMQRTSEHWAQMILALKTLVHKPEAGFLKATEFLVGSQQVYFLGTLQRCALAIDRLGYDSSLFLDEKSERFTQLKLKTRETLNTLPSDKVFVLEIFNKIDPTIFSLARREDDMPQDPKGLDIAA